MEVSTISGFFDGSVEGGSSVTLNLQVSKDAGLKVSPWNDNRCSVEQQSTDSISQTESIGCAKVNLG